MKGFQTNLKKKLLQKKKSEFRNDLFKIPTGLMQYLANKALKLFVKVTEQIPTQLLTVIFSFPFQYG